jgi:membrane fusion protein, peptide pheromone/bacteriocin exporter
MQRQLYPPEFAEDSLEALSASHPRRSSAVYLGLLAALAGSLALLPVVRVDVAVRSTGIIRPATEKHDLRAGGSGIVASLLVSDGDSVQRGEPVLTLRQQGAAEQSGAMRTRIAERRRAAADLAILVQASRSAPDGPAALQTAQYRGEMAFFLSELREVRLAQEQADRELARTRELRSLHMATAADLEEREYALQQARDREAALRTGRARQWQAELAQVQAELVDLGAQAEGLRESRALLTVSAPVSGSIEQLQGLSPGSFVSVGDRLAVVSPHSELVAEIYVPPGDIGLIRAGAPVRMQIDAFNYNQWGTVTGRVMEISDDFLLVNQHPVFRVRCSLDQSALALRNGFRGTLKKGMTFRAHFQVANRTLLQLLFDDANDWLNPARSRPPAAEAAP